MKTQLILIGALAAVLGSGCAMVDKDKADGLEKLAVWKSQTTNLVNTAGASREKYQVAQSAVNDYISGLTPKIDLCEGEWFSQMDLSCVPTNVTSAVEDFRSSARTYRIGPAEGAAIAAMVYKFVDQVVEERRHRQGEALKAELAGFKWEDWDAVRREKAKADGGN